MAIEKTAIDHVNDFFEDTPKSHLTIGQCKNCRIPIAIPLTPNIFMDFILRSFYNTSHSTFSSKLDFDKVILFENCIHDEEKKILHVSIH